MTGKKNNSYDLEKIQDSLKKKLDHSRFQHTLGVSYTAATLAMAHDGNIQELRVAGLLHDCAKSLSNKKKLHYCHKHGISISEYEKRNPVMLHAKLGAQLAAKDYNINNPTILNSILWHTTGKPEMNLSEKIIYIADYIEPNRKQVPNLAQIRKMAFIDLDECMYMILKDSLDYLRDVGKEIDSMSMDALSYYQKIHKRRGEVK